MLVSYLPRIISEECKLFIDLFGEVLPFDDLLEWLLLNLGPHHSFQYLSFICTPINADETWRESQSIWTMKGMTQGRLP